MALDDLKDTPTAPEAPQSEFLLYQPAQKWLKDRQGRELTFDDILHYQKIIVALTETARLMQAVDMVLYPEDLQGV